MTKAEILLAEVKQEAKATRALLERVPFEKANYKPHEKSMTLKRLATHVAEINGWWKECLTMDVLDFSKSDSKPKEINSTADILALHDDLLAKAEVILNNAADEKFNEDWTMRNGEVVYFTMPKAEVVRTWCMNHLYHHRGQLTVYLRLLDVPLPSTYGPTADLNNM
ncbi:MAG: DinB family protein [Bacteroidetes bacterium]|nr:DinB family protein [Bacteroidota bacterium]